MPKKADSLFENFKEGVKKREMTRAKIEDLLANRILEERDILTVYDGLFLGLFTDFEEFIEKLFYGLLEGKIVIDGRKINQIRKVKISPQSEINSVILGGKQYIDWLPYDRTIERAKIFFHDGKPFTNLNHDQKSNLGYYHKIRNAIAHKSPKAQAEFDKIIQNSRLLPSQKTPAGYLRSKPRGQETQYEIAAAELIQIASILSRNPTQQL
ncbi:hypothetical protein [Crocosphaera sp. XPORK-15E]|uniref:hypothetical protein n=1 Tax=Crocosphaera sp. XPORK-15E TaxID=3110247 RepID=UPI002B1FD64A|nr:hypothetical protein [Crocosphaera sp. XPORK-15E]MEA5532896.1 hypothetical protein [Crocosphaera sp. XPORK-15E]